MVSFLNNLGLFLLRLVTGSLVSLFAAREMADRSDIIYQTLEFFSIGAPDIVKVFLGCLVLILGAMLVIGFWPRFIALALLILLAIGGYCWTPQSSQINFHMEALYGILFFYLFLIGGGQWAVSRRRTLLGQSVLESEQSILANDKRPSILSDQDNSAASVESDDSDDENDDSDAGNDDSDDEDFEPDPEEDVESLK